MSPLTRQEAHVDHTHWKSEIAMWQDDVQQWRKEREAAQLTLAAAFAVHTNELADHATAIQDHEANLVRAECFISECERSLRPVIGGKNRETEQEHNAEFQKQRELREAHELIKQHHYKTMGKLGVLAQAVGAET